MSKVGEVVTISKEEYNQLLEWKRRIIIINNTGIDLCRECQNVVDGFNEGWRDSKVHGLQSICYECEELEMEELEKEESKNNHGQN
jgi:hypothetical protein